MHCVSSAQECSSESFLFPISLTKDMTGKDDNYRGPAVRALCQITDVSAAVPLGSPGPFTFPTFPHSTSHSAFYACASPLSHSQWLSLSAGVSLSLQSTMLQAIERYMKQAIVDKVPSVSSSALVSSLVCTPCRGTQAGKSLAVVGLEMWEFQGVTAAAPVFVN